MTGSATAAQRLLALDPGDVAALTFELSALCDQTAAEAAKELADLSDPLLDVLAAATRRTRPSAVRVLTTISRKAAMPPHFLDGEPHDHTDRPRRVAQPGEPLRIGVGGPVGSGKTALVAALCRQLRDELSLAVLTNDIYTTEDADFLRRHAVLPDERIAAVQTGGCPHTAIRDDITANLDAIDDLIAANPPTRPDPGRVRRRQPHRDVLLGPGRRADLRHRRGRRRQGAAQGRAGRDLLGSAW